MEIDAASNNGDDHVTATNYDKFRLLMWKNFLIQYRHPVQTALELLISAVFASILVLIRSVVKPETVSNDCFYAPFQADSLSDLL